MTDEELTPEAPVQDIDAPAVKTPRRGVRGWFAWIFRLPRTFGGLCGGLVFLWWSLTPGLLPRPWFAQAAASAILMATGYGLGSGLSALLRKVLPREPGAAVKRLAWRSLAAAAVVGTVVMVILSKRWANELRGLMGIKEEPDFSVIALLVLTLVLTVVLLVGARLIRSLARFLIRQVNRVLPHPVSVAIGVALAVFIVVGFAQGFLWQQLIGVANSAAGTVDGTTTEGTRRPTSELRSGSPASKSSWDTLGRMGRDFVGRGPTVEELETFNGGRATGDVTCCTEPIRVYAGLDSADNVKDRAALVVRELERTGGFERKVLVVFNATGTGWINPRAADAIEYMYGGDTAEASMQYSFLPSWISFLVDQTKAQEAGEALIDAVEAKIQTIPEASRPKLLFYGESLGSFATEAAFDSVDDLRKNVDGALLVGPTFSNKFWRALLDERDPGSPMWHPTLPRERGIVFATTPADLEGPIFPSSGGRVLYLQNPSDAICWWSRTLWRDKPDWAKSPAPPDRSSGFGWTPIVTFWQITMDLADSLGVPTGYGHNYGSNVADGWVAIAPPDGWTAADTARLKAAVGESGD